jgi:hypothetical protein
VIPDVRVAFLLDAPHLETLPFLREPILELERVGAQVDIFLPDSKNYLAPDFAAHERIRVIITEFADGETGLLRALAKVISLSHESPYDLFLATPKNALIVAAAICRLTQRPLIALCDEVFELDEPERSSLARAYSDSSLCIITDQTRIPLLEQSLGLGSQLPRVLELPNCARQNGHCRQPREKPSGRVRVLNLGFFDRSFGADLIIESLDKLDAKKVEVIVHERAKTNDLVDASRAAFEAMNNKYPIDFIVDPVPYEQLPSIVEQFDIGLALYDSDSNNDNYCGKGSGKLGRYLQHGLPVIVRGPNLHWIEEYGAGKHVESGEQLSQAVKEICANYSAFSERALQCYEEHFRLEKYLPPIIREIDFLMESCGPATTGEWEAWVSGCVEIAWRLETRVKQDDPYSVCNRAPQGVEKHSPADLAESLFRALWGYEIFDPALSRKGHVVRPPSTVTNFPSDLKSSSLNYEGIYDDSWISESCFLILGGSADELSPLLITGEVPFIDCDKFSTVLDVSIDGNVLAQPKLCTGEFLVAVDVPNHRPWHLVELAFSDFQKLPSPDSRNVGAKLGFVGFVEPPAFLAPSSADQAGQEVPLAGVFRDGWLMNDSSLVLDAPSEASVLRVRGKLPSFASDDFSTVLTISIDGQITTQSELRPGKFNIGSKVLVSGGWHRIDLSFSEAQQLPDPDCRMVGAMLDFIGFIDNR